MSYSITGTNSPDFVINSTTCTSTLNASSTCGIQVTFSANAGIGTNELANIVMAYTGASGSPITVPMSGLVIVSNTPAPATSFAGNLKVSGTLKRAQ